MRAGVLVDIRKCIACRSCQVACKRWHDLPGEATDLSASWTNPPETSKHTWNLLTICEVEKDSDVMIRGVSWRCMHCAEAPCVSVCPAMALSKTPEGLTLYDENKCIGCRYCLTACPFDIPHFDWEKHRVIMKCTFCVERLMDLGQQPACVSACPTGALTFYDDRAALLGDVGEAKSAGAHVFGDTQLGGLSWIYLSDIPFDEYKDSTGKQLFPQQAAMVPPDKYKKTLVAEFSAIGAVGGAAVLGLIAYSDRRTKIEQETAKKHDEIDEREEAETEKAGEA